MQIECYHITHKDQKVKGFLDYGTCSDLENTVRYNVYTVLEDNNIINLNYTGDNEIDYMCIYAHGSRVFGTPRKDSDIDFVLFYKGSIREDDLFNIFAMEDIYIEHVKCDFNPIEIDDESDIEYYIQKHDIEYHKKPILERKVNLALALDNFDDDVPVLQTISKVKSKDLTSDYLDIYQYAIDLGLPSGTLWFKYNLGVNPDKLITKNNWYGNYYAWGELKPKKDYNWLNYKWCKDGLNRQLIKYCNNSNFGYQQFKDDILDILPEDDIAYQQSNGKLKIPSTELMLELLHNCYHEWFVNYNICDGPRFLSGLLLTSKINGNQIFFPAAGYYNGKSREFLHKECFVWLKETSSILPNEGKILSASENWKDIYHINRCHGVPIRPIINNG